jgi:hypothetical protein
VHLKLNKASNLELISKFYLASVAGQFEVMTGLILSRFIKRFVEHRRSLLTFFITLLLEEKNLP